MTAATVEAIGDLLRASFSTTGQLELSHRATDACRGWVTGKDRGQALQGHGQASALELRIWTLADTRTLQWLQGAEDLQGIELDVRKTAYSCQRRPSPAKLVRLMLQIAVLVAEAVFPLRCWSASWDT